MAKDYPLSPGTEITLEVTGPKNDCINQLQQKVNETFSGPETGLLSTVLSRATYILAQRGGGFDFKVKVEIKIDSWEEASLNIKISPATP